MNYTLWSLIGDHPVMTVILAYVILEGVASAISAARGEVDDE